jgi:hypothetical protein
VLHKIQPLPHDLTWPLRNILGSIVFPVIFVECVCLYLGFPKQHNHEHLCLVVDVLMNNVVENENRKTDYMRVLDELATWLISVVLLEHML